MTPNPALISHIFSTDSTNPAARLVHLALAAIADEGGHAETTVHTLHHMTGLLESIIEIVLGHNRTHEPLLPASIKLADGVVIAELATGVPA